VPYLTDPLYICYVCLCATHWLVHAADTRFAREEDGPKVSERRRQALNDLLPSASAKAAALTLANVRGFGSMTAKSHLEEFCEADIGGAVLL
jgi:hypothetical protein